MSVKMSKVRLKKPAEGVQTNGSSKHNGKINKRDGKKTLKRAGERSFFFPTKRAAKKEIKPVKKTDTVPPTDTNEFSSNWKNLLQTLVSNPEKKPKSPNLPKHPKTASLHKDSQKQVKPLHKPTQAGKSAAGRTEKRGGPSDGKDSAGHKQFKAEKRKRKEESRETPMNKKKKAEGMEKKTTEPDIWFDDVDPDDIEAALGSEAADIARKRNGILKSDTDSTERALVKEHAFEGVTRTVAMDCEMVGVGFDGEDSILARVSLVNRFGKCIYDKYVKPTERVTDYRTEVSGIRPKDLENGEDVRTVQKEVADILNGRILVGHAIHNDLKILFLGHPKKMIRDTQKYKPFQERVKSGRPALRDLCKEILSVQVQKGEHSSVQDAQAAMRLYTLVKKQWEVEIKATRSRGREKSQRKPRAPKQQPDRT